MAFMVMDELVQRTAAPTRRHNCRAPRSEVAASGDRVVFCKPMEFMNVSGQAVARTAQFWKIPPEEAIVVHDDLDLPFGRLKLGAGGGPGGHNGLRSIIADWGTPEFCRVRMGI